MGQQPSSKPLLNAPVTSPEKLKFTQKFIDDVDNKKYEKRDEKQGDIRMILEFISSHPKDPLAVKAREALLKTFTTRNLSECQDVAWPSHSEPHYVFLDKGKREPKDLWNDEVKSLLRGAERLKNGGSITELAMAFGQIIYKTLDNLRTEGGQGYTNMTTPILNLSLIYTNDAMSCKYRKNDGTGRLDLERLNNDLSKDFDPLPFALLAVFAKNHNHLAGQVAPAFSSGKENTPASSNAVGTPANSKTVYTKKEQEDRIFDVAHVVNRVQFMNVVLYEFFKGLTNLDILTTHFDFEISKEDKRPEQQKKRPIEYQCLYELLSVCRADQVPQATSGPDAAGDVEKIQEALEDPISIMLKAMHKEFEPPSPILEGKILERLERVIIQINDLGSGCRFNRFRELHGLKRLSNLYEWNPDLADKAKNIYNDIDQLDLITGLFCESPGNSQNNTRTRNHFGLGPTLSNVLITDLITTIRGDPIWSKVNEDNLSKDGYRLCQMDSHAYSHWGVFTDILLNQAPLGISHNNAYIIFPFISGDTIRQALATAPDKAPAGLLSKEYITEEPKDPIILNTSHEIREVFNNYDAYETTYKPVLDKLTAGYGFLLGMKPVGPMKKGDGIINRHRLDKIMNMYALMPDVRSFTQYGDFFRGEVERLLKRGFDNPEKLSSMATEIDLASDVIIPACTRWACEQIYHLDLDEKERDEKLAKYFTNFCIIFASVFDKATPDQARGAQRKAVEISNELLQEVKGRLKYVEETRLRDSEEMYYQRLGRVVKEFYYGRDVMSPNNHSFLDRLILANRTVGRFRLVSRMPEVEQLVQPRAGEKGKMPLERFEATRLSSNTMAFAVVAAVKFAQACIEIVNFYLKHENAEHLQKIRELSLKELTPDSKKELWCYYQHAMIWGHPLFLHRHVIESNTLVTLPSTTVFNLEYLKKLKAEGNSSGRTLEKGTTIIADINAAVQNGKRIDKVEEPDVNLLFGAGPHRCPAVSFVKEIIPEILQPIWRLEALKVVGAGLVEVETAKHPRIKELKRYSYETTNGGTSPFPLNLRAQFSKLGKSTSYSIPGMTRTSSKKERILQTTLFLIILLLVANTLQSCLISLGLIRKAEVPLVPNNSYIPSRPKSYIEPKCNHPIISLQKWDVNTMVPGPDGQPAPIEYILDHPRAHRLSVVDIDRRDMQMAVFVDDALRGHTTNFTLDRRIECGDDVKKCLDMDFSAGVVVIPPGQHKVRIAWVGKEYTPGTNDMEWNGEYARRFKWQLESCGK